MKNFFRSLALCSLIVFAQNSVASSITSLTISKATLQALPHCLHYKVIGVCFWLKCSIFGCYVDTSLKVDHYLPDVVVSSFSKANNNPWLYAKTMIDPVLKKAGDAAFKQFTGQKPTFGAEPQNSRRDLSNHFYNVDVIGNPVLPLLGHDDIFLPSAADSYKPYYSSLLDSYAWHYPALERFYPGSLIPGLHDVGKIIFHDWGSVYPRNGFINQPNTSKAAAVTALRAATIITQSGQPHLYWQLSNDCGSHCHADAIKENDPHTQFQMIYPTLKTDCTVFGKSNTPPLNKSSQNFSWILWRHYHGCLPHAGKYLGSVNF